MSTNKYFDKFPIITYSNNQVVDITKRVALLEKISSNPYVFYPYDIVSDERAEQFSGRYYKDVYKSWILYLSNKIIDPYYEWYMTNSEFDEFITKKYNSIPDAIQKIKYYRNNWEIYKGDVISVSQFNALTTGQKNYWEPIHINYDKINGYRRKQNNWVLGTNQIVRYTISASDYQFSLFKVDEMVDVTLDPTHTGRGQVLKVDADNNHLFLQHVKGYFKPDLEVAISGSSKIVSQETNITSTITDIDVISDNIPDDEKSYWDSVSYYDYEYERNEYNKSIRVIDSDLSPYVVKNLKDLMKVNF